MTWQPALPVAQWESLRRELVWIRRGKVGKRESLYRPADLSAAWRLIRGTGSFELSGRRYSLRAGDWIFPGRSWGKRAFSSEAEIISIRFRVRWPGGERLFEHRDPLVVRGREGGKLDENGFALVGFVQEKLSPEGTLLPQAEAGIGQYLRMRHYFDRWFEAYVELMMAAGEHPRLIRSVDDRVLEVVRLMEASVRSGERKTEEALAATAGLSLSQFKRLFIRDLRQTPKAWLDAKRLEFACERLREEHAPVKQIGYELGFRSPNHFSSWFQKQTGKTPSTYRYAVTATKRR